MTPPPPLRDVLDGLEELIDTLRAKGVRSFRYGDVALELMPLAAAPAAPEDAPTLDESKCRCGHYDYEHTNGACLVGCEDEKCAPEAKA